MSNVLGREINYSFGETSLNKEVQPSLLTRCIADLHVVYVLHYSGLKVKCLLTNHGQS